MNTKSDNKKFIFERKKFNYLENIKRVRITENRNLTQGIRMNRKETTKGVDYSLKPFIPNEMLIDCSNFEQYTVILILHVR